MGGQKKRGEGLSVVGTSKKRRFELPGHLPSQRSRVWIPRNARD